MKTKQEQIEEMAKIIDELYNVYDTTADEIAEGLYNAGYRKADVAEIERLKAENEELTKVVSSKVYDIIDNAKEIADAREAWEKQAKIDVLNELKAHLYAVYGTNTAYPYYVYGTNHVPLGNKTAEDIVKNIDELIKEYEE